MKCLVSVILLFFGMCCYAGDNIRYYETTSFSMKKVVNGEWTDWSEWEESGMIITMNLTKDVVEILSPKAQIYNITENKGLYIDIGGLSRNSVGEIKGWGSDFFVAKRYSYYHICDAKGRTLKTMNVSDVGEIVAVTNSTITSRKGSWIFTWSKEGKKISARTKN